MIKEQREYCTELRNRILAKGVTIHQASILMGYSQTNLHSTLLKGNPSLRKLLEIERFLAVETVKWDNKKIDTNRVLRKPFLPKDKRKR